MSRSPGRLSLTDIPPQISLRAIQGDCILMMTSSRCHGATLTLCPLRPAEDHLPRGMTMPMPIIEDTGCKTHTQAPTFRLNIIMRSPVTNSTTTIPVTGSPGDTTVTSLRDITVTLTTEGVCLAHPLPPHDHQGRPHRPAQADVGHQQALCILQGRPTLEGTLLPLTLGCLVEPTLRSGVTLTTTRPRSTSGRPRSDSMTSPPRGQAAGPAAAPAHAYPVGPGQPGPAGRPPPPRGPQTTWTRS